MLATLHHVSETIYNSKYKLVLFTGHFNCWLQLSKAIKAIIGRIVVQKHKMFGFHCPSTIVLAKAEPKPAIIDGSGLACRFQKPELLKARPKPWLSGQAGLEHH
jgi:hypothetical protein